MQAVKRDMNAVSARLEEDIPADLSALRELLFNTAALYDKLIKSCQAYLDGSSPWSSVGKRRKKMVADLNNGLKPSEKLNGFREFYNVTESIPMGGSDEA